MSDSTSTSPRGSVVHIARCPDHGLHGERTECYVCGGAVEQVRMVAVDALLTDEAIERGAEARYEEVRAMPGMRDHWPAWDGASDAIKDTYRAMCAEWFARVEAVLGVGHE